MEIARKDALKEIKRRFSVSPVVAILGPRQCGKTTLAQQFADREKGREIHKFDLENPRDLERLENPLLALEPLTGWVIIDEIQKRPNLFPVLRVLIDKKKAKYLLLGSASRDLIAQSSETLAGRISYFELGGFSLSTVGKGKTQPLWLRGGFPRSFLARSDQLSFQWRRDFITTFLERDIPNLGIRVPARALRRFWMMMAHYHGQIFEASEIGRSLDTTHTTMKRYLDILSGTFLLRQIQPWFYNTKKRLIKRPKIYFRDSGLLHAILSLSTKKDLLHHPRLGASWEGFVMEHVIRHLGLAEEECFFWGVHTGGEIDLIFQRKGRVWGVEMKYKDAPSLTPSMKSAKEDLNLKHLWVVYPGNTPYALSSYCSVLPFSQLEKIQV